MYFKKISITEELPPLGDFVTTIDEANQQRVYRLVKNDVTGLAWNMRDADGDNSPNNNLKITHWLKEVDDFSEKINTINLLITNYYKDLNISEPIYDNIILTDEIIHLHKDNISVDFILMVDLLKILPTTTNITDETDI